MSQLNLDGVGVRQMTVTVNVLTVDGNRRMSHRFFDQIPEREAIDRHTGELRPGTDLWGYVDRGHDDYGSHLLAVVHVHDGRLYEFTYVEGDRAPDGIDEEDVRGRYVATRDRLLAELPQLYLGG